MKTMNRNRSKGAVLLVVLLIVMAVTVVSLGYLSSSDVELAVGDNMMLRTEMDYLAESALEHGKGLIRNPQDVSGEFWGGASDQQVVAGSDDYYDVTVTRLSDRSFEIAADAYRRRGGDNIGHSSLEAELVLDPVITLWVTGDAAILSQFNVDGDIYCSGVLTNLGTVDGDVYSTGLTGSITGRHMAVGDLSMDWPRVTAADYTSHYATETAGAILAGETFGPYSPVRVVHRAGDLEINGGVTIEGMLVVEGDLVVSGQGNLITASKNVPAFLVTGDLIVTEDAELHVIGLGVVDNDMKVSGGVADVNVQGSLFINGSLDEVASDSSGNNRTGVLNGGPTWQPSGGQTGGAIELDGSNDTIEDYDASAYLNGLSAITVSLWVKSDVTNQDRGIFFVRNPTGADYKLGLRYDRNGAYGGGNSVIKASVETTVGYTQIESTSNAQTTGWQHLAITWQSGSNIQLYIDGQLNSLTYESSAVGGTVSGVQKFMLGRGTKGSYWDGMIDDVRIYDRVLDVNDIYPPVDGLGGLLNHWKLDESGASLTIEAAPSQTAIRCWSQIGTPINWISAGDAFFRSIKRQ